MYVQVNLLGSFKNMLTTMLDVRLSDKVTIWFHFLCKAIWDTHEFGCDKMQWDCNEIGRFLKALEKDKRFVESSIRVKNVRGISRKMR
jgi:hypothetical protein